MAPVIAVGLDAVATSKILGILLSLSTLLLLARIPSQVFGRAMNWLDLLAPALTGLALPFVLWSVSGMENALEAFLLVVVVVFSIREMNNPAALPYSSVGFFALALTRPEGIVFWLAAVAHRLLLVLLGRRPSRMDFVWLAGFLVPIVVYHGWHYQHFGELVPNTYYAKADHRSLMGTFGYVTEPSDPGFTCLRSFVSDYWLLPLLPLLPLSLVGFRRLTYYSLPLLMLLAGAVAILFDGGDWMPYHRFVSPLTPLLYLSIQEGVRTGLKGLSAWAPGLSGGRAYALAGLAIAAAVAAIAALPSATKAEAAHARPFGAPYSGVEKQADRFQQIAGRLPVARASVLTPDIGATAYKTDLMVIDLAGLSDPYIARHQQGPKLADYVFGERRPDIIFVHQPWVKGLDQDSRMWNDYAPVVIGRDTAGNLTEGIFVRRDLVLVKGACPDDVPWEHAASHVGELRTVRGRVVSTSQSSTGDLLLDVGAPGAFVVAIRARDRANFLVLPDQTYMGETICVTGTIQDLAGRVLIYAETPDAMAIEEP